MKRDYRGADDWDVKNNMRDAVRDLDPPPTQKKICVSHITIITQTWVETDLDIRIIN